MADKDGEWASYHLFYHSQQDRLLLRLVWPAVRELWLSRHLLRFFFIRYRLGGPHIRLRLLCPCGVKGEVDRLIRAQADAFFSRWPSTESLSDEWIRRIDRQILAIDPEEVSTNFTDNSIAELTFRPELERYGGVVLIDHSLAFFAVSSACALRFAELHQGAGKPALLACSMRALVRQAMGFASNEHEFIGLLAYAITENAATRPLLDRADQAFERQPRKYTQILLEEVENSICHGQPTCLGGYMLTAAARRLRSCLQDASHQVRWQIVCSQLHMTANRLGINNPEEIYIGRILWRAVRELPENDLSLLRELRATTRGRNTDTGDLNGFAESSLRELFTSSQPSPILATARKG